MLAQHAEDPALVRGGHMHEGAWSARLGIPGRPAEAESSIVARDLALARLTGGRYHVLHVSSAQTVELVRAAKADGVRVTAECTPQHLVLTDAACADFDPVFKMNPPLREQADVDALRAGLRDGTIDAIATDHAPHAPETKAAPFEEAPPGMLGVETALGGRADHARRAGPAHVGRSDRRAVVAPGPRSRASMPPLEVRAATAARSRPGRPANLCVIDPRCAGSSTPTGWPAARPTRRGTSGSSPARSATPSSNGTPTVARQRAHPMTNR